MERLNFLMPKTPVEGRAGHTHIPGDLGCWFSGLDELGGGADLRFAEGWSSAAEVAASSAALGHGVVDAFSFDLQFHLSQGGHDGEDHSAHGSLRVDVAAAEIQDAQSNISGAKVFGEVEHFLGRTSQSVQRSDHQSVVLVECIERSI